MFGSEALEVGIGVTLMLLFVSLICTAAVEGLEIGLKTRAADLERGIRKLLQDPNGTGLATQLYSHPLVYSLFLGDYDPKKLKENSSGEKYMARAARAHLPSYIPSANFAAAILDIAFRQGGGGAQPLSVAGLRSSVADIPNPYLKRALLSALNGVEDDMGEVKANLELWFNGTMDRVSGWYKRRTQTILFCIGIVAAVTLNLDVVTVATRLTQDKSLREAVVAHAKSVTGEKALDELSNKKFNDLVGQMHAIGYPIGWTRDPNGTIPFPTPQACRQEVIKLNQPKAEAAPDAKAAAAGGGAAKDARNVRILKQSKAEAAPDAKAAAAGGDAAKDAQKCRSMLAGEWFMAGAGWLITALAVMLGAPFWFDVLNKFMVIRSTVKPREKSQEEGSEDRSRPARRMPPLVAVALPADQVALKE